MWSSEFLILIPPSLCASSVKVRGGLWRGRCETCLSGEADSPNFLSWGDICGAVLPQRVFAQGSPTLGRWG